MFDDDGIKYLTAKDLIAELQRMDPSDRFIPNSVGNLKIVRDGKYIGWVNFAANIPAGDDAIELHEEHLL